jgi:hypothetical protein
VSRDAEETIAVYHQQQLHSLLNRVRDGFVALDEGAIDECELDGLIYRYKRAADALWKFCNGSKAELRAQAERLVSLGDGPDWWAASAPRGRA